MPFGRHGRRPLSSTVLFTGTAFSVPRIGRATPVGPAESPRAYKTIGPTSQHRPKVITVTMVVLRNPLMMKSFGCA